MAGLAEALHVNAGLAALVGHQAIVAVDLIVTQVVGQWCQQLAVHLPFVARGEDDRIVAMAADLAVGDAA
ncbi:hypothetical protein D3C78_1865060 [compost metagenome]